MDYRDRTAIVTGGSRGIGKGCVRAFALEGAANVVFCSLDAEEGKALERDLRTAASGTLLYCYADVTDEQALRAVIETAINRFGRLDCLVNNAGWHPPHRPIDGFSLDDFRQLLELNLISAFNASRIALPHLRRTSGNIINISSLVAQIGQLHATTYVATKGALTALTKALAIDEAIHGVRVNSISPGNILTPLWEATIDAASDPAACRRDADEAQPLGRMGTIEEAGRLALFIAAQATFTTGVDHVLAGGAELAYGKKSRFHAVTIGAPTHA